MLFKGIARYEHIGETFKINTDFYKEYFNNNMLKNTDQSVKQNYLSLAVSAEWKNDVTKNKIKQNIN